MLADHAPMPTLATADLARAREFYEGTLGFTPADDVAEGLLYRAGNSSFLVYPTSFAGTNKATSMSFNVPSGDFEAIVGDLRGKGAGREHPQRRHDGLSQRPSSSRRRSR